MKNILVPIGGSSQNVLSCLQYTVDFIEAYDVNLFVVKVFLGSDVGGTSDIKSENHRFNFSKPYFKVYYCIFILTNQICYVL